MSSEMMILDTYQLAAVNPADDVAQAIAEELAGMGQLEIPRASIPTGGLTQFQVSCGQDSDIDMAKSLEGVIIHHHPTNAYWSNPFAGAGSQPDCSSMDGHEGVKAETGELIKCASCPLNQYGSEVKADGAAGRGKACKNSHRLYILRAGDYMPILLTLPPTALKALRSYLQALVVPRSGRPMLRPAQVVTSITLKQVKTPEGIAYAVPEFKLVGVLTEQTAAAVRRYADAFRAQLQGFVAASTEELPF